jgi:YjjG family noncanonical pyrimidine nucleotidase
LKYTWLLFDADDTLFDFSKAEAHALEWTLEQSGVHFEQGHLSLYSRLNQQVWQEFERGLVTSQELRIKRFRLFFHEARLDGDAQIASPLYLKNLALGTDLHDGADELIHALRGQVHLALVTNGLKDVQRPRLEHSSLHDCFEKVFISEEMGVSKPSRAFFETVFAEINQPARENVLIIGDSLTSDMQGGLDFGIHTCWFNPKHKLTSLPVTYQIAQLNELHKLL